MSKNYLEISKRSIPTYLFYNRSYEPGTIKVIEGLSDESIEHYGCSIASAVTLKKYFFRPEVGVMSTPSFRDIHPDLAMPLHYLAYPLNLWYPAVLNSIVTDEIRYYTREEINDDPDWEDMAPPASIGYITGIQKQPAEFLLNVSLNSAWPTY